MKEDFLHYVWKFKLFSIHNLQLVSGEELQVLKSGIHNLNSGPDFLNAHIIINDQTWVGNVEIHLKSSDWYLHQHEIDSNYDAVILHVVWEDDTQVFMKNNIALPTLVVKDFVLLPALKSYKNLFTREQRWIPCEKEISTIDSFTLENWKERLFFERLERKSEEVKCILEENQNDFEATLFQLLAKNFGLKVNSNAFFELSKSIDYKVLRKLRFNEKQLAALFFGQAGFLEDHLEESYHQELKKEYHYLQHKFTIKPLHNKQFSFFRMRPSNFPTIRIAQLVALYFKHQNLFSSLLNSSKIDEFYDLFVIEVNPFWKSHYTFEKSSKLSSKKLTKSFIDLLIINTIIPLKFLYQRNRGEVNENEFLGVIRKIKPEKNNIISNFSNLQVSLENACDSQALLELKNNYCSKKRCLQCAIGLQLLKRNSF